MVNVLLTFLLVFSLIAPSTSFAAESMNEIENGMYDVPFTVLKKGSTEASVMDGYTEKPARVVVKDGTFQVDLTLTNSSWYKDFTVEGQRPEVISENTEQGKQIVRFITNAETVDAWVHIVVTGIPGFHYDNQYDVDIAFHYADATMIELEQPEEEPSEQPEEEQPEEEPSEQPEEEQPEEEPSEQPKEEQPEEEPGEQPEEEQPEEEPVEQPKEEQPEEEPGEQPEEEQPEEEPVEQPKEEQPEEGPTWSSLQHGKYDVPFAAKHATEDRDSAMSRYLVNPAQVTIGKGKQELTVTVKESHQITNLVLNNGELVTGTIVNENTDENTRTYAFNVDELKNPQAAKVSMRVALPNGNVYENTQDFRLFFDLENAKKVEDGPEQPEQPSPNQPNEGELVDGRYQIEFNVLKSGSSDVSVMDGYTEKPATIYVKNGEFTVDLTLLNESWYRDLTINGQRPEVVTVDETEDKRVVRFAVSNLIELVDLWVHIRVEGIPGFEYDNQYDAQLQFNEESLTLVEKEKEPTPVNEEKPKEEKPKSDHKERSLDEELVNGEYTVSFSVLKKGTTETSVMDEYTKKPATVFFKDGTYTIDLTLTNRTWYEDLKINGVRPAVVNEDLDKNEQTVRFETKSIHEAIDAWVHIIVKGIPGFDYDNQYEVDIQFDRESLTLVKADQAPNPVTHLGTNNDNGNGSNNGNDNDLIYDRSDNGAGSGVGNAANVNQQNPQTSDPALVSFYLALLLLSTSFFVWKWRQNRRKAL